MERAEALKKLELLIGSDMLALAAKHEVPVHIQIYIEGKLVERVSKGWAGHTVERFLGLPLNSARSPNFGSWELKVVPVYVRPGSPVRPKETMAITMIDPVDVRSKTFEDSHLLAKMRKMVVVARTFEDKAESAAVVWSVGTFDLEDGHIYRQVKADYDLVRETLLDKGFDALKSEMGVLVQPRTKGRGHGSTSRAFYARKGFVQDILGLNKIKV